MECIAKQEAEAKALQCKDMSKLTCSICDLICTSRNALFKHIRAEGHDGPKTDESKSPVKRKAEETLPEEPGAKSAKADN